MPVCPSCGKAAPEDARFCAGCGASLSAVGSVGRRKTVTVLFCDVVGSTALGESIDPESLQQLLARYFERMSAIVGSFGGSVEKFIGDAVMAVFGVPRAHEDDALRACRAAMSMRASASKLGLQTRIGVMTGEVVVGTPERLATGDAVNVAARLQQAAAPAEVLVGRPTFDLVRPTVDAERIEPLRVKGKAVAVPAYRLLAVLDAPERLHEARFVGRDGELDVLDGAWHRALAESACQLVTVVGDAGVGKSRLAEEFCAASEVTVVRGRCLPYGDGITYWPVIGALRQLGGPPTDPAAAAPLRRLVGESDEVTSAEEIAWAFRKLLEERAPLICVFDDLQWAEPALLELVEHVALLSSEAPILLLCLARPEVAERFPVWPVTVRLEPLASGEVDELIPATLGERLREQIARAAGGNPLFVHEIVAMTAQAGGDMVVPPTLQALLAARLDQLDPPELQVLQRGAVEGEVFHRGAVQALSADANVTTRLAALVRKKLVRTDRPQIPNDDAFRFRHLLIRDAAYQALTKASRAELHAGFADWLEQRGGQLVELDQILGYHLEQAHRYRQELNAGDDVRGLGLRAAARLAAAGRNAMAHGDVAAAVTLLRRASRLTPADTTNIPLELALVTSLGNSGRFDEAITRAEVVAAHAAETGDQAGSVQVRLERLVWLLSIDPRGRAAQLRALIEDARPLLESTADDAALTSLWYATSVLEHYACRFDASFRAATNGMEHARLARDPRAMNCLGMACAGVRLGPTPVADGLAWSERQKSANASYVVWFDEMRIDLLAWIGRFDDARELVARVRQAHEERGMAEAAAGSGEYLWRIEMTAGDFAAAERASRASCERLQRLGAHSLLSTQCCELARSLYELGRYGEAESWVDRALELGGSEDVINQLMIGQVRGKLAARRGEHEAARRIAVQAVTAGEGIQAPVLFSEAVLDYAEVLSLAGHTDTAAAQVHRAIDILTAKGATALVEQATRRLDRPARS